MDGILCIHHNADVFTDCTDHSCLSQGLVVLIYTYMQRCYVWALIMRLLKYVNQTVRKYEIHLVTNHYVRLRLTERAGDCFKMVYDSELDVSQELNSKVAS